MVRITFSFEEWRTENHQWETICSSLPLRPTEFVSKERHITDMSSNRKKIIEPWEIVGETCGSPTKIAMFACFCPSKKPLFSLFLQIPSFPAKIQNKNTSIRLGSTNPIFCAQCLPNWRRKSTLKRALRTDKKKQRPFLLVWWRHQTEWNQTSPVCFPMWTIFFG